MQNKPQSLAISTRQSYSRRKKQRGSLGAEPLAVGSKWGFGGGSPTLWRLHCFFLKNTPF